ncbi:MAG: protein kinase [Deltaproteobacteria bacterium]|nr:protein kinase [Deltaproteobacteria bacterium]
MSSDNRVGETLASKYKLEALLGSGGMGHVYRAVNTLVGRPVAIKLLRIEHAENLAVRERFLREARAANLVRHPNVVDVVDIGQDEGGAPFIVQELLEGEDLAHLAARNGGKLPLQVVIDFLLPVIEAVAEAHLKGVVHRDLKPENVFLARSPHGPVPKLLDFGISKVRSNDLRATEVGVMMGTPAYMPPEQVQGARDADARSDIWALGVMLFELIAGRLPFDAADAPALFVAIATRDAPTLLDVRADVTPAVSQIVARCLRRRPDERYPTAAELARDLRHVLEGDELEPTGKRSLPPSALAIISSKSGAPAGPLAPTALNEKAPAAAPPVPPAPKAPEIEPIPEAPSLAPPPLKPASDPRLGAKPASDPRLGAKPASDPRLGAKPASDPQPSKPSPSRPSEPRGRIAAEASLPGVMLAPGSSRMPSTSSRAASHEAWGLEPKKGSADMSAVYGIAVVGIVTIATIGVMMQLAHRPEGWPLGKFVAGTTDATLLLAINGGLGLVALAIAVTYALRGHKHWRGELGGGASTAVVNAIVAGGAFFCAIELVSAMY